MSDSFEMLVDIDATLNEGDAVVRTVLDRFRKLGLITGSENPDCVLGDAGYRPGPAIADFYKLGKHEGGFWGLVICGVEPKIGRSFNMWALGPSFEALTCPACGAVIEPFGDSLGDAIGKALCAWLDESGKDLVPCPECRTQTSITEWQCKPPLGFGNVSFRFWNWPPLDSLSWKVDIAKLVREVTEHTVVKTHGHL